MTCRHVPGVTVGGRRNWRSEFIDSRLSWFPSAIPSGYPCPLPAPRRPPSVHQPYPSGVVAAMSGLDHQKQQLSISSQSSNDSATLAYMAMASDPDSDHDLDPPRTAQANGFPSSSPRSEYPASDRNPVPARAATLGTPHDLDQRQPRTDDRPHARSEDLNHSSSWAPSDPQLADRALSQSPAPPFYASSRPGTPGTSNHYHHPPSSSDHSEPSRSRPRSVHSDSSLNSDSSTPGGSQVGGTSTTHTSTSVAST